MSLTFGSFGTFTDKFELITYSGTLSFQPQTAGIAGSLALTRTGFTTNTLDGSVSLQRVATNRFDQLTLAVAILSDANGKVLNFQAALVERDTALKRTTLACSRSPTVI